MCCVERVFKETHARGKFVVTGSIINSSPFMKAHTVFKLLHRQKKTKKRG